MFKSLLQDERGSFGPAFSFISLVITLIVGPFIWVILSPFFESLNTALIGVTLSAPEMYPDAVTGAMNVLFGILEKAGILFFLYVAVTYLKEHLQPWTME